MNEQEVRKAIECVENFRDRYKEWANKDDTDFNVKAINVVIGKAKSLEPKVEEIEEIIFQRVQYHYQDKNEDFMIGNPKELATAIVEYLKRRSL